VPSRRSLTEQGIEFIKQNKDRPFAVTIAWKEAHSQQRPPHRYDPLFANDSIPLPSSFDEDKSTKPRYFAAMKKLPDSGYDDDKPRDNPEPPPGAKRENLAVKKIKNYYRCIEALDDYVGRLLKTLEEVGQLDNTIIVYTGDNGYFLGEHGRFEKMTPHEESVRIPLLIRYPGEIKPGTVSDAIVRNIDVAPTLYDLTGLKGPGTLDGHSLRAILESSDRTGASVDWPQDVYLEWQGRDGAIKPGTPGYVLAPRAQDKAKTDAQKKAAAAYAINPILTWRALRTRTHKYAVYLDGDLSELYDLRSDPNEAHNLIGDSAQKELIANLHQRLLQLADATHDPLRSLLSAEPSTQARPAPAPAPTP
jgi:arylsulfatase A-like enzyme